MGNIEDDHDEEEAEINKIDNNTFIIDGMFSVDDFNDYFDVKLESEDYGTISGFLINLLGRIPTDAEEKHIEYENFVFKILEVKEKRIEKIKVCVVRED